MKITKFFYYAAFFILAVFPVQAVLGGDETGNVFEDIDSQEAFELIEKNRDDDNFIILDVRTPGEYRNARIEGSILMDFYSEGFYTEMDKLDRSKVYFIYCRSGNRSGRTLSMMREMGFSAVYNLEGGLISWVNSGFPVTDR